MVKKETKHTKLEQQYCHKTSSLNSSIVPSPPIHTAILDSGSSHHFLTSSAPCSNRVPIPNDSYAIPVHLPDGSTLISSHTANVNLPLCLPPSAVHAHILPGLHPHSLLSIGQLCDSNCTTTFSADQVSVTYNNETILQGTRDPITNLWHLPLPAYEHSIASAINPIPDQYTDHIVQLPAYAHNIASAINPRSTLADRIAYYHAACYSPVLQTWCDAIDAGNFVTFPELTSAIVRKHPPQAFATAQGHLDQTRANVKSTKNSNKAPVPIDINTCTRPLQEQAESHHVYAASIPATGQVYSDATGRFLCPSSAGNNYLLVVYDYDSNYIFAEPMKNRTSAEHVAAYERALLVLKSRGLKPKFQRLDNEASQPLRQFLQANDIDFQLAPPHVHRRNAAERAIRTFKNHFIAGLCSTDKDCPLHLWDKFLPQAILTLNLLRQSRLNPLLSAQVQMHGPFDFNRTPLAPPGTKVFVHVKPSVRETWAPHAVAGWYIGPAMHHYRCFRVWTSETQAERIADTLAWFPTKVLMPSASSCDIAIAAANDLIQALQNPSPASALSPLSDSQHQALTQLADIFRQNTLPSELGSAQPRLEITVPTAANPPLAIPTTTFQSPALAELSGPIPSLVRPFLPNLANFRPNALTSELGAARPNVGIAVPTTQPRTLVSSPATPPNPALAEPSGTNHSLDRSVHFAPTAPRALPTAPVSIPRVPTSAQPNPRVSPPIPATPPAANPSTYAQLTTNPRQRRRRQRKANTQAQYVPPSTLPTNPLGPIETALQQSRRRSIHIAAASITPSTFATSPPNAVHTTDFYVFSVLDPVTGASLEYRHLIKGDDANLWETGWCNEYRRLGPKGTNTMRPILPSELPPDRSVGFLRMVAAYKPHKIEKHRVRFTIAHRKHDYPGTVSTPTVDITTVKCHLNSVISTPNARYMTTDITDFYLNTPMERPEYLKIPVSVIPASIIAEYNLQSFIHNGYITYEVTKGLYGLVQAGKLANTKLVNHLAEAGFVAAPNTPGFFLHVDRPISFTLCVDDFGIKYANRADAEYLIKTLESHYDITTDWTGCQYIGLTLDWDYIQSTVDISMPGYIAKALLRFNHAPPKRAQHSPHAWTAPTYGAKVQLADAPDTSAPLSNQGITFLQQIIGTLLYYARAVDNTMLVAISALSSEQTRGTEATMQAAVHLLNYCATHPDAVVRFHKSDMVLHIHSDASYLSVSEARSRLGGFFFLGPQPTSDPSTQPPHINGPILINSTIIPSVMSSAAEAELGALFYNAKDGANLRTTLHDLGHPQPATPIQTDNACASGIANESVRQRRSKAMDMRFYWLRDRIKQGQFVIFWRRGIDNDADYFTKHHSPSHHRSLRSRFLHSASSIGWSRRGCVDSSLSPTMQSIPEPANALPSKYKNSSRYPRNRFARRTPTVFSHSISQQLSKPSRNSS